MKSHEPISRARIHISKTGTYYVCKQETTVKIYPKLQATSLRILPRTQRAITKKPVKHKTNLQIPSITSPKTSN